MASKFIIPIEVKDRELNGKTLLALEAARRGFEVFIGDQRELSVRCFELGPGIYHDKSIAFTKFKHFLNLKRSGFKISALCEEGLVYRDVERYLIERCSRRCFDLIDYLFCWGNKQYDDLNTKFNDTNKIVITGNPRLDLLKKPFEKLWTTDCDSAQRRFGEYILFSTNFSRINRKGMQLTNLEILKKRKTTGDPEQAARYYEGLVNRLTFVQQEFLKLISKSASEFPNKSIVVKVHPSESSYVYKSFFESFRNVFVVENENIIPLILGSSVLVHNSCTTSIEGLLLKKHVLSFVPGGNCSFDSELPNSIGSICYSGDEAIEALFNIMACSATVDSEFSQTLESWIAIPPVGSASAILDSIGEVEIHRSLVSEAFRAFMVVFGLIRTMVRFFKGLLYKQQTELFNGKFDRLTLGEITQLLIKLEGGQELNEVSVQKVPYWNNVFSIKKVKY